MHVHPVFRSTSRVPVAASLQLDALAVSCSVAILDACCGSWECVANDSEAMGAAQGSGEQGADGNAHAEEADSEKTGENSGEKTGENRR